MVSKFKPLECWLWSLLFAALYVGAIACALWAYGALDWGFVAYLGAFAVGGSSAICVLWAAASCVDGWLAEREDWESRGWP